MTTARERVEAGARWLDEHVPNWLDEVDLDLLQMSDKCNCVLGQIVSAYDPDKDYSHFINGWNRPGDDPFYARRELPPQIEGAYMTTAEARERGFETDLHFSYRDLADEWRALIEERRS